MKSSVNTIVSSELEDLLESFNSNPNNAKVIDYVSRSNLFDIIGKSRHEMVHSRMIAELLAGKFFRISNKMTLIHFLDIVVHRAKQQNKNDEVLGEDLKQAILTRSLQIDSVDQCRTELTLKSYKEFEGNDHSFKKITPQQAAPGDKKRLDVFLRYSLANTKEKIKENFKQNLEIFIENKVLSTESDNQTIDYYNCCKKKTAHKLFIYLTPISLRELNNYSELKTESRPQSDHYIHLSYQDIVDRILEPLLAEPGLNTRDRILLNEYVNCLELPALPDSDKQYSNKLLSIMATSQVERKLIGDFISDSENARLLEIAVNRKLNKPFYAFGEKKYLTFDQALKIALLDYANHHSELDTLNSFKDVIKNQGGGAGFLLYAVRIIQDNLFFIPTDLYEYNGKAYTSITEALRIAVKDFIIRKQCNINDVIDQFRITVSGRGRNPSLIFVSHPTSEKDYCEVFNGLFIRKEIKPNYIDEINRVLGPGYTITSISSQCYHDSLLDGNDSLWKHYEKKNNLYTRLFDTNYYFRSEINTQKISDINNTLSPTQISLFNLDKKDEDLLDRFFRNNRSLILSVYKILLETETDVDVYKRKSKDYRLLIRP